MRRYKFSVLDNLKLKSYAKINLYLHVLNKRDDGFHNISSLLSRIDLYDSITFEKSEIFEVEYSGPCLLYTSPSPRDVEESRMPSSA